MSIEFVGTLAAIEQPLPQQRRRQALLQRIHAAAVTEFSAHCFQGATTQAIAQRAGLSKPQLHYYIHSKEALYRELLHGVLHSWGSHLLSVTTPWVCSKCSVTTSVTSWTMRWTVPSSHAC